MSAETTRMPSISGELLQGLGWPIGAGIAAVISNETGALQNQDLLRFATYLAAGWVGRMGAPLVVDAVHTYRANEPKRRFNLSLEDGYDRGLVM